MKIIGWWSGGVTSAVVCKICIDLYGLNACEFIFIDTKNEDEDTYRFKKDCENWYKKEIKTISEIGEKYNSIQDVWKTHKSLNVAHGAICSYKLKRIAREKWEKKNKYNHQAFGFDINEKNRAISLKLNHPNTKPIFPLLMYGYTKEECFKVLLENNIKIPNMYSFGFKNNNCFKTGCVQGGIGYWQKMKKEFPEKFNKMADIEHELTDLRGAPVTMLKDQSKKAKREKNTLLFLKPHKDFPNVKDISMIKGREPKPLFECNGFCGTNDLFKNETENELNLVKSEKDF